MLKFENFSYSLSGRPILQNIGFSLSGGSRLSIIGPNGAGKSTLLKCLLRLTQGGRRSGRILLHERELSSYKQRELARLIAYVPQAGGWIPPYTVEEFLRLGRYAHAAFSASRRESDRLAVERALALTGMEKFAGRPLPELSGGERQKAYLAAALAQTGNLLLLDEPTAFLDPKHAADIAALLKTLNRDQGLSIVTVTHDLLQPLDAGGSVLALREGGQIFFGGAQALMTGNILQETYSHSFSRFRHPLTGRPVILPEPGEARPAKNGGQP